ncbi:MAG: choice-of-anchor D domain-containing protein [Planctomycetes bacterium]|nr:choice-of-anchor D domain-containing protein [Planctomycetota bacterium]MCW8135350.1 choice-of-anchor D domain-containing protein [Planctomycetota bacterium]
MTTYTVRFLSLAAVLLLCGTLKAQITVELLTGSAESQGTGSGYPINTFWYDLRSESIYLASDLTSAGITPGTYLSAIELRCAQLPGQAMSNVRIRLKETTATTKGASFETSGYTVVYGPTNLAASAFTLNAWHTFTFASPYMWTGNNLLVDFTIDGNSYTSGGGCYVRSVGATRTTFGYDDNLHTYPFDSMVDGTRTTVPSMRVTYLGGSVTITTPASLPTGTEGVSYNQTLTAVAGATPYTWTVQSGALPGGLSLSTAGVISGTPNVGTGGQNYNVTIRVTDSTTPTPEFDERAFTLYVLGPPAALPFTDDFSTDKGWVLGSGSGLTWQRGPCAAAYVPPYGNPEPTTDHSPGTDNFILGDNIGAVYPNNMGGTIWATSPPVNCSSTSDVELNYWRWLNVEQPAYDHAYIQVSNNGSTWVTVWENTAQVADSGWFNHKVNISAVAGNQPSVRVRFGIGPTDSSWQFAGWCIDDVEIRELPSTTKLVATDFVIISPYTVGSQNDPAVYTGTQANFEVTVNNTTANNITVNSFSVTVTNFTNGNVENVGTFTLTPTIPFIVNANTTGQVITGAFDCTTVPSTGSGTSLRGTLLMQGTEASTNKPVETTREEIFYVNQGPPPPPPQMNVREVNFSGPTIDHNQTATGTQRDFGSRDLDAGPGSWLNIVIINNTSSSIQVGTPTLGGTHAAHFRLDTAQWTSSTMTLTTSGATSQIYFSVRFDPHDVGAMDAYVEFTHNATSPTTSPYRVLFAGTGTGNAPRLQVHEVQYTGPEVTHQQAAAGTNRDFGTVAVSGSSGWVNIVIWNRFVTNTTINPLPTLASGDVSDFVIDTSAMSNPHVIPGTTAFTGTIYFSIRFAPQSAGNKVATVSFGHNASNPATTPFQFEVIGNATGGANPAITVYEATAPAGATTFSVVNGATAANGRDFGTQVTTAGPTGYLTIRVQNTGGANLTIGNPSLVGANPGEFDLDTGLPWTFNTTITPGNYSEFGIAFDPTSLGQKNATVSFTHNATGQTGSPFTFGVTGMGLANAPIIEVREVDQSGAVIAYNATAAGTGRAFGGRDVNAGPSTALTIYIENVGFATMTLGTPTLAGTDPTQFVLNTTGFATSLAVGNSTTFTVAFDPSSYGAKSALVQFTHDDPSTTTPFRFEVTGFGDAPSIEVREGSVGGPILAHNAAPAGGRDFGAVQIAAMPTAALNIVLVNAGNANLTVQLPTLTGTNAGDFVLTAVGFPATVPAAGQVSFSIQFNAAQVGIKEAQINFAHNDSGATSPFIVRVRGLAQDPAGVRIDSSTNLPRGQVGNAYGPVNLAASGGAPAYTWSIRNGTNLPVGLSMTTAGVISGTPSGSAGVFTFDLRVTDSNGGTADATFSISIDPAPGQGFKKSTGKGSGGGCAAGSGAALLPVLIGFVAIWRRKRRA